MPTKVWAVGEEVLAADFNTFVQQQVVSTFASLGALQTAWPDAPIGAMAITTDTMTRYVHVATGSAGWVGLGPNWISAALTGTIPNSAAAITAGTINVAAAPFNRFVTVTGIITVSTTVGVPFQLQIAENVANQNRKGRNTGNGVSASPPPLFVNLPAGQALTITATAQWSGTPNNTGTIFGDATLSRMDAVVVPA